jgi:cell wall-associated NlpC family hydrolase
VRPNHLVTAVCSVVLAAGLLIGDTLAATPKERIREKQAEAQRILDQVSALDGRMGRTVEEWNGARYRLGKARVALAAERKLLARAKRQQHHAVARVRARVIALYESDSAPTTLAILFGSSSVGEMIDHFQAAQAVADADHHLAVETRRAKARYAAAARRLQATELRRAADFAQLDAQRRQIEGMLAERKQLLSHVQSQVAALQVAEARRQAKLEAEARARLAAEAEARRKAEALAAAQARAKREAPPTTATTTTTTRTPAPPPATTTTVTTTTTEDPPPATDPAPDPGAGHTDAASIAMHYLGVPYVWGGATPAGFDCSGLVMYVFAQLGIALPHYAAAQFGVGEPVARDQLQPGDLVFFDGLGHVGIYIGGGEMIHAPHTGDVVKISPLSEFGASYVGARRI